MTYCALGSSRTSGFHFPGVSLTAVCGSLHGRRAVGLITGFVYIRVCLYKQFM